MRDTAKAFIVISGFLLAFACGWLTSTFEFSRAIVATVLFGLPLVVGWITLSRNKSIRWHEYISFAAATLVIQGLMIAAVCGWFNSGLDKRLSFKRIFHVFRSEIKTQADYANIEMDFEKLKGGDWGVRMNGSVNSKDIHDRLILMVEGLMLGQDVGIGYGDHVEYPGKPKREEKR